MKIQSHPLSLFILGLAYALERVALVIPGASPNLKAYMFDFSTRKAQNQFEQLMLLIRQQINIYAPVLDQGIRAYFEQQEQQYGLLEFQVRLMFSVEKKIDSEESFNYSIVVPDYRRCAQEVYGEHKETFDTIVRMLVQQKKLCGPDRDFGILFVDKSDS